MVRVQRPSFSEHKLLVGSDLGDATAARREIEQWARENGYHLSAAARQFSVFDQGVLVREWIEVDARPAPRCAASWSLLGWLKSKTANAIRPSRAA